jgi:hypothetical protein
MTGRLIALVGVIAGILGLAGSTPVAVAATGPVLDVSVTPNADFVLSGSENPGVYKVEVENVGDEPTSSSETTTVEATAPPGTSAEAVAFFSSEFAGANLADFGMCSSNSKCEYPSGPFGGFLPKAINPGQKLVFFMRVGVPANVVGPLEVIAKVSGAGLPPVEASATNTADPQPPFGTFSFDASVTDSTKGNYTQAGGHPYKVTTEFNFGDLSNSSASGRWYISGTVPVGDPQEISGELPPGLVVNPQGVPHCSMAEYFSQECSRATAVGSMGILRGASEAAFNLFEPAYNLQPEGNYPGQLGITVDTAPFIVLTSRIRDGSDYGISATNVAIQADITRVRLILWGVPADSSHDPVRAVTCADPSGVDWAPYFLSGDQVEQACAEGKGASGPGGAAEVAPTPFITMPTECSGEPLTVRGRYNTWQTPSEYATDSAQVPAVDGCNQLSFEPSIEAHPTTNLADSPSGLEVNLHVPQNEDPEGVATPALKESVVRFPEGLKINPASAEGLGGCTEAQVGLHSEEAAHCPAASKLGTVEVKTRLLTEPLEGAIYLATPHENPSQSLLGNYLVAEGQGLRLKLYGGLDLNPDTGRITARFLQNPQLPFEELAFRYFGGARGAIRTPALCGDYKTTSAITPFSAPESGPPAAPTSSFQTSAVGHGSVCPTTEVQEPHAPRFRAGTERPQAGRYSPFALRLVREDGSQELRSFEVTLPPGLTANLSGIPYCPEGNLAAAADKSGRAEQSEPSCSAASEVGTVEVASGPGPTPINVPGRVYLAGPYKGAPLSLAFVTPVIAGPFDLGTSIVRAAVYLDPQTVQNHVISDPLPTVLNGIPLDIRSITVKLDRREFMLNPTSCEEFHFAGSANSILGTLAPLSQRFQVGECAALRFKPRLRLSLSGGIHRNGHPRLRAVVTPTPGGANLSRTQVTLPPTEFVDNGHLRDVCSNVQFEAGECPGSSVYGHARAETPLLSEPLEGPVFLQPSTHRVPDLVAALSSGAFAINLHLHARQDSVQASIRTTFEGIPDVPLTRFVLNMAGGKKGLLVNSKDLCAKRQRVRVRMVGQNGKAYETQPLVKVACGHDKKRRTKRRRRSP